MSDTPCTCAAHGEPASVVAAAVAVPLPDAIDPVTLERVVEAFTAAAADSADARMQALEGRVGELEQVVAAVLAQMSQDSMQDMPMATSMGN